MATMQHTVRTLLIDNYDSYTYNLHNILAEVNGVEPLVVTNDALNLDGIRELIKEHRIDNIVISPGPGTPARGADIGVCIDVLRELSHVPILGVCLGHQALAHAHGGRVVKAPEPVHGRVSTLQHSGHLLLAGIPSGPGQGFEVVRYHSLCVEMGSLPECLEPIAWTCGGHHAVHLDKDDEPTTPPRNSLEGRPSGGGGGGHDSSPRPQQQQQQPKPEQLCPAAAARIASMRSLVAGGELVMALAHASRPHYGVQFHPESVSTRFGVALLANFCRLTLQWQQRSGGGAGFPLPRVSAPLPRAVGAPALNLAGPPGCAHPARAWPSAQHQDGAGLRLAWSRLPALLSSVPGGSEAIFASLFRFDSDSFWLDSSSAPDRGRFSYMGGRCTGGPLWRRITYRLPPPDASDACSHARLPMGTLEEEDASGRVTSTSTHFLPYLDDLLRRHRLSVAPGDADQLPFNFWGGLVGYLGFELKAECGGRNAHASPTPDAAFLLADRSLAVDHANGDVYVLAMHKAGGSSEPESRAWLAFTAARLRDLAAGGVAAALAANNGGGNANANAASPSAAAAAAAAAAVSPATSPAASPAAAAAAATTVTIAPFRLRHDRDTYMANIETYRRALHDGESYEVCATTALERPGAPDPQRLYTTLRALNPAPYAAWLSLGGRHGLSVVCSSPERFLRCDRGSVLEARPIKGTAPRMDDPVEDARTAAELAASEKERAENLMIVDLLRNDLGRVCDVGSVHVPGLMEIESFATVHQMVSTVRGLRRPAVSVVDCLRATFPGGSMTGAPKVRTMEILDPQEGRARGIYSGSLGFIGFNDTFDLNIVIRTAVVHRPAPGAAPGVQGDGAAAAAVPPASAAVPAAAELGGDGSWIRIGAGGAIVVQSDTAAEYEEMRLKARALLRAVGMCDGGDGPAVVDDAAPAYF
ncbi:hypothetical protein FOA52_010376 [Chlamydomonas sp. UWO 241]|nr:hypothetical protein FOA52_010376 [Chlamydomonas sp. UWO 241]